MAVWDITAKRRGFYDQVVCGVVGTQASVLAEAAERLTMADRFHFRQVHPVCSGIVHGTDGFSIKGQCLPEWLPIRYDGDCKMDVPILGANDTSKALVTWLSRKMLPADRRWNKCWSDDFKNVRCSRCLCRAEPKAYTLSICYAGKYLNYHSDCLGITFAL